MCHLGMIMTYLNMWHLTPDRSVGTRDKRLYMEKRKKFQIKTVRDLLHENIDKPVNIAMITNKVNIRKTKLYYAFKKEYGITPKKYLQQLRFNAIKKELLLSDPNLVTVSGIAKKYHFRQMGHFAAGYKQLFGETPSQTLRRKR